jgi:2-oxoglutarate decarboxylase
MPLKTDPDLGINSWLEDELYQQYLNDRTAVDESWKHVFEDAPNGHPALAPSPAPPLARSAATTAAPKTSSRCAASPPKSRRT